MFHLNSTTPRPIHHKICKRTSVGLFRPSLGMRYGTRPAVSQYLVEQAVHGVKSSANFCLRIPTFLVFTLSRWPRRFILGPISFWLSVFLKFLLVVSRLILLFWAVSSLTVQLFLLLL